MQWLARAADHWDAHDEAARRQGRPSFGSAPAHAPIGSTASGPTRSADPVSTEPFPPSSETTTSATVSGDITRRLGQTISASAGLGAAAARDTRSIIGVSTTPGQIAMTEIPRSANSAAADLVRLKSAALLAA